MRRCPTLRVEYEQALAIGDLGSCLDATRHKRWGAGPWIMPLEPGDESHPLFVTYVYKPGSLYNRRFLQRQRLKELLGRRFRKLVGEAQWHTKAIFLKHLTAEQSRAIRRRVNVGPGQFWRAERGKTFLLLPTRLLQQEFDFGSPIADRPD